MRCRLMGEENLADERGRVLPGAGGEAALGHLEANFGPPQRPAGILVLGLGVGWFSAAALACRARSVSTWSGSSAMSDRIVTRLFEDLDEAAVHRHHEVVAALGRADDDRVDVRGPR